MTTLWINTGVWPFLSWCTLTYITYAERRGWECTLWVILLSIWGVRFSFLQQMFSFPKHRFLLVYSSCMAVSRKSKSSSFSLLCPNENASKPHLVRVTSVALESSSPSISLRSRLLLWDPGIAQQKCCSSKRNCEAWQGKQLGSHFNCNYGSNQRSTGLLNLNALNASVAASLRRTTQPFKSRRQHISAPFMLTHQTSVLSWY